MFYTCVILVAEDDFDPQEMLTITFPANSSVGNTSCTHYTILDDDLKEGEESFRVSVEAVNSLDVIGGEHSTVLITIQGEDGDGESCMIARVCSAFFQLCGTTYVPFLT